MEGLLQDRESCVRIVREIVREAIKNTEFYKTLRDAIRSFIILPDCPFLIIEGGYGIGKSTTVVQILEELGLKYKKIELMRFDSQKEMDSLLDILKDYDVIIWDDIKLTKRSLYSFLQFHIDKKSIIIINHIKELENVNKIFGRSLKIKVTLNSEDLQYLKRTLEEKLEIKMPQNILILNLRDLVNVSVALLLRKKGYDVPILSESDIKIKNIIREAKNVKMIIEKTIRIFKEYDISDVDFIREVLLSYFTALGYNQKTLKNVLTKSYIQMLLNLS